MLPVVAAEIGDAEPTAADPLVGVDHPRLHEPQHAQGQEDAQELEALDRLLEPALVALPGQSLHGASEGPGASSHRARRLELGVQYQCFFWSSGYSAIGLRLQRGTGSPT